MRAAFVLGFGVMVLGLALSAQAPDARPVASNLKPVGVPPLSRAVFDEIEPYNRFRRAMLQSWEPGRRSLLITTRFGSVDQLHRVAAPMGDRQQVTFLADRVLEASVSPTNASDVVIATDRDGDEFFQLDLLNPATPRGRRLTAGGRSRNQGPTWSRDGHRLAFTSTARNGRDGDIVVSEPRAGGVPRMLVEGTNQTWRAAAWSPDGAQMLAVLAKSAVTSELHLVDTDSGRREKLGPLSADAGYFEPEFGPNGKSVYFISTAEGDHPTLVRLDLTTRTATPVRPGLKWDVEQLAISDRYLAYVTNEDGVSALHVLSLPDHKEIATPALPKGVILNLRWRKEAPELAFTLVHARSPGDVYSFVVGSSRLEQWTKSETGGLDTSTFAEPELVRWTSFDGLSISGFYYRPPTRFTGRRPVIVLVHGGPEGQSLPIYQGVWNYYLNELGVSLILPNVRGSTGYGTAFLNADNGMKREDSVKDIGALLEWIGGRPELDSSRILVTGGSYGGYMTLATMKLFGDRVRAAIETVGISNFRTFLERTEAYRRDLRRVEYGDERDPAMRAFFETIAPLAHAASFKKPMFIVAGRQDPRVPWQEGQQMFDALQANRVPSWFLVAEDECHGFAKRENQDYLLAASVEFVRRFLLN